MNFIKLTKTQMKVLSDILNKTINNGTVDLEQYNKRIVNKLIELKLIIEDTGLPTKKAIEIYLLNLKKGMILINQQGENISLYKPKGDSWDFIWFMTKGKTGGGNISCMKIIKEYKID